MNSKIMKEWVAALRSGEYKQGKSQLRQGNKFCCLGVLCNIHAQHHPEFAAKQAKKSEYDGKAGYLSETVMKWAEIKTDNGSLKDTSLSMLNDDGANFEEIADIIEEYWKNL